MGLRMAPETGARNEQKTPSQSLVGIQGASGAGSRTRREDAGRAAQKHDLHPTQINEWRKQLLDRAADVFGADSKPDEPVIDLKDLHAKIGLLTLEKDFLQGAAAARRDC